MVPGKPQKVENFHLGCFHFGWYCQRRSVKSKPAIHGSILNLFRWYVNHQTLGWWDDRPSDLAYYIEDCRISRLHSRWLNSASIHILNDVSFAQCAMHSSVTRGREGVDSNKLRNYRYSRDTGNFYLFGCFYFILFALGVGHIFCTAVLLWGRKGWISQIKEIIDRQGTQVTLSLF